jgi:hypothetical protein
VLATSCRALRNSRLTAETKISGRGVTAKDTYQTGDNFTSAQPLVLHDAVSNYLDSPINFCSNSQAQSLTENPTESPGDYEPMWSVVAFRSALWIDPANGGSFGPSVPGEHYVY